MESARIVEMARFLDSALLEKREVERLSLKYADLSIDESYKVQDAGIQLRLARGEQVIGYKMGLTSQAKREQMNLNSPIYGVLTDRMKLDPNVPFSCKHSIHPKIEPEIAFLIGRDISSAVTLREALEACSGVCAAMEILDSRYLGFKYFSLPDVIADNSSSAFFVLSKQMLRPQDVDLSRLEMVMSVNGEVAQKGYSDAISSHPGNSIVQLCDLLLARGLTLPAGSIVLAGAATQAVMLEPVIGAEMNVKLKVETLGSVQIQISKD